MSGKKKSKAFVNRSYNCLHLNFPNGNQVSTIWGGGSYTENHDVLFYPELGDENLIETARVEGMTKALKPHVTFMQSKDAEVMIKCGKELKKKIHKKFDAEGSGVIGYLSIKDWLDIVNKVAKERKVVKQHS